MIYDDLRLNPGGFGMLDSLWGPHTINQFPVIITPNFLGLTLVSLALAMKLIASEYNWLCPPLCL